jgi:hypothetical protein
MLAKNRILFIRSRQLGKGSFALAVHCSPGAGFIEPAFCWRVVSY